MLLVIFGKNATLPVVLCCATVVEGMHVYRYYRSYLQYTLEVDVILMTGMMKIVSFSICYYDGQKNHEEKDYFTRYAKLVTKKKSL